jgi:spore germination protein KB
MLIPYVKNKQPLDFSNIKKPFYTGMLVGSAVLFILIVLAISVLGPNYSIIDVYPAFTLAKKIGTTGFSHRIEVVMAGIWFLSIFIKLTTLMLVISTSLKQIFQTKEQKIFTVPVGMVMVPLSVVLAPNVSSYITTVAFWIGGLTLIFMFLPVPVFAITWLRLRISKGRI